MIRQRPGDQPQPTADLNLPIMHNLVTEDLQARLRVGIERYGQGLRPFNGRSFLRDAYEEVLDLAVYLRGRIYEEENPDAGLAPGEEGATEGAQQGNTPDDSEASGRVAETPD